MRKSVIENFNATMESVADDAKSSDLNTAMNARRQYSVMAAIAELVNDLTPQIIDDTSGVDVRDDDIKVHGIPNDRYDSIRIDESALPVPDGFPGLEYTDGNMTKADLTAALEAAGVDVKSSWTKAEMETRLAEVKNRV